MAIKGTGRSTDLSAASMQQVAGWLEKLGLGQYAQRFAENDIDFALSLSPMPTENWPEIIVTDSATGTIVSRRLGGLQCLVVRSSRNLLTVHGLV